MKLLLNNDLTINLLDNTIIFGDSNKINNNYFWRSCNDSNFLILFRIYLFNKL